MTTLDEKTGEIIEATSALVPAADVVRPLITAEQAREEWNTYLDLCNAVLDTSDYQKIGRKYFKKKSAWRKLATYYGISEAEVVDREIQRDEQGRPIFAAFLVRIVSVTRRGERSMFGYHEAHLSERCCPTKDGEPCAKRNWESHHCCKAGCDGWLHWSHPGDIPATAQTRAKNRGISDLIGAGEVSAEEMDGLSSGGGERRRPAKRQATTAAPREKATADATPPTGPPGEELSGEEKTAIASVYARARERGLKTEEQVKQYLQTDSLRTLARHMAGAKDRCEDADCPRPHGLKTLKSAYAQMRTWLTNLPQAESEPDAAPGEAFEAEINAEAERDGAGGDGGEHP